MIREERPYCVIFKRTEQEKKTAKIVKDYESTVKELADTKELVNSLVKEVKELKSALGGSGSAGKSKKV